MATISSIVLADFKKFTHFTVSCRSTNILVGPNNAGKSSILDAMRILADVLKYARQQGPTLRDHPEFGVCATYTIPTRAIGVPIANVVRDYGDEFARLEYKISNGRSLQVRLHPENGVFAFLATDDRPPKSSGAFRAALDLDVVVVPTLSALEDEENFVQDITVRRNENTRLASRSFRNIVYRQTPEEFTEFQDLCRQGWPEIEVQPPDVRRGLPPNVVMMYSESRIPREVYWSGFGFQVWMQMMLQFLRSKGNSILVLDEPDIYLHPDLQRRLLSVAKRRFGQMFLATHSTEIINEADPGDVLMVDSAGRSARRINSDDGYKRVYAYLGSSENAEFARIAKAKRIVFFEGKERTLVRKFARRAGVDELLDDPYTIYLQAGGFAQWRRIKEVDWALHEIFGLQVRIGAIFDRDYRSQEEIEDFQQGLEGEDLWIGVLDRKEIENYALVPAALIRALQDRVAAKGGDLSAAKATEIIETCCEPFFEPCRSQIASTHLTFHKTRRKDIDDARHIQDAMARFDKAWRLLDSRLRMIPGKEFLAALSTTMQRDFGASITVHQVVDDMKPDEVDPELVQKLTSLSEFFSGVLHPR